MPTRAPIRVLVVDDSPLARQILISLLVQDPEIRIVGEAGDGREALAQVESLCPDLVTMDLEMPVMGGLEAIERIMAERPLPILVLSTRNCTRTAFAAVSRGALEVISKEDLGTTSDPVLLRKVRQLARVDVAALRARQAGILPGTSASGRCAGSSEVPPGTPAARILAIATSIGGPQALQAILARLPADFPIPIVVAQHVAEGFARGLAEWLDGATPLRVMMAKAGEEIHAGSVYINPSGSDLSLTPKGKVLLSPGRPGAIYHPSCDALLRSVADAYRADAVALILGGMGHDGVAGMEAVKAAGGTTFALDGASSVVFGMNNLAIQAGCIDRVLGLDALPAELHRCVQGKRT
jgi:two-component system, chemotaxis family, protein-glutamate methylesterase/glutaminase